MQRQEHNNIILNMTIYIDPMSMSFIERFLVISVLPYYTIKLIINRRKKE